VRDLSKKETEPMMNEVKKELKSNMNELKKELKSNMNELKKELKSNMNEVKKELKSSTNGVKKDLKSVGEDVVQMKSDLRVVLTKLEVMKQQVQSSYQASKSVFVIFRSSFQQSSIASASTASFPVLFLDVATIIAQLFWHVQVFGYWRPC
jgi:glycyl-tRNA synthetase (class II)